MSRLVDPVHFFNARGTSALTEAHLAERIRELEEENARLRRLLKLAGRQIQKLAERPSPPLH